MDIRLVLSTPAEAPIIKNLWPLYQHDVSEFDGSTPNRHGLFGVGDGIATLAQLGDTLDPWWQDPRALFPYLILADGKPAGFNLIAARPRLPQEIDADFVVHEFFLLHPYRGGAVAEQAVAQGLARHPGRWEVVTYPNHPRAIAFWRRTLARHAPAFSESEQDHPWGRKVVFRFDSEPTPSCP